MSDKKVSAAVITRLELAYGKEFSKELMSEWHSHIGHLSMDVALQAVEQCIQNYKWRPSISEYLEISRSIRRHQLDESRKQNEPLPEHIIALQKKGLAVQRALTAARKDRAQDKTRGHRHAPGTECPICQGASSEESADECRTCMILEDHGISPLHFH